MTSQCPRCGTPVPGNYPICQRCGLDFRSAGAPALPPQQQLAPPQSLYGGPQPLAGPPPAGQLQRPGLNSVPAYLCPRCIGPLYRGFPRCTNCGLDVRAAWETPPPIASSTAPASSSSTLPIALALVAVVVLTFAGTLAFLRANHAPAPSPSMTPSPIAAASPSPSPTPTATPTPTETPVPSAPDTGWITLSPNGALFTAEFPADPTLATQTEKTAFGSATLSLWTYIESAHLDLYVGHAAYPTASMKRVNASSLYDFTVGNMTGTVSGLSVERQTDVTVNGHDGRAFTLTGTSASLKGVGIKGQMYLVGDNLYMVYAAYDDSVTDFTEIDAFIADFQLKI